MVSDRSLQTILFTDIVGSTERAIELGDHGWGPVLTEHHSLVRREIRRFGGREIKALGDGFLAAFPRPGQAIRCAWSIRQAARRLGLEIRSGVHTGPVHERGGDLEGVTVHIGSRIAQQAGPDEILVSNAVREMETGGGFRFEDRGERTLKGVPGAWRLHALAGMPSESLPRARRRFPLVMLRHARIAAIVGAGLLAGVAILAGLGKMEPGEEPAEAAVEASLTSIAVLPFRNLSGDPRDAVFADGIAEEVLDALARTEDMRVVSRSSSFQFRHTDLDVRTIGDSLGVGAVLEGSVRRSGDRIKVTARLVDAETGYDLWSESFERRSTMSGLLESQEEIARGIVRAMGAGGGGMARAARPTTDLETYSLVLKGRHAWAGRMSVVGLHEALGYFRQAIARDSTYAPAWSGLADVYLTLPSYTDSSSARMFRLGRQAAERALALDEASAEAHTSLARALQLMEECDAAEAHYRRALEINPNYPTALHWYGSIQTGEGREEGLRMLRNAVLVAPLSSAENTAAGFQLYLAGRLDEAIDMLRTATQIEPRNIAASATLILAHADRENLQAALRESERLEEITDGDPMGTIFRAYAYARAGEDGRARAILDGLDPDPIHGMSRAMAYAALGEHDEVLALLRKPYVNPAGRPILLRWSGFDPLRADPRFVELVEQARARWDCG